jgi:hypothetical protein
VKLASLSSSLVFQASSIAIIFTLTVEKSKAGTFQA